MAGRGTRSEDETLVCRRVFFGFGFGYYLSLRSFFSAKTFLFLDILLKFHQFGREIGELQENNQKQKSFGYLLTVRNDNNQKPKPIRRLVLV